jgi:phosphatidylglycerophosphatase A
MIKMITTLCGIGLIKPAPGTWGSLAALILAMGLHGIGGFFVFFIATFMATALGYWAIKAELAGADTDPPEIVIDELAGQWIALWPVSLGAYVADVAIWALWPGVICAFLAFRLFDIVKPGPVGWADAQPGAFGIMADDIIAGWLAAMVVAVMAVLAHMVM